MSDSVELLHGWYSLHDFRHFDRDQFRRGNAEQRRHLLNSLAEYWDKNEALHEERKGSFGVYEIVGHKADLLFLNLRPSLPELTSLKRGMALWDLSHTLRQSYSYFGVVELSNYVVSSEQRAEFSEMIEKRLRPKVPERQSVCFYPMNKKRDGENNWYMQPIEERRRMMRSHGLQARKHSDTITQLISGSIGLDDYEWGVTLFADDPLSFKNVVTDLRFDEVSARFADFGAFLVGNRLGKEAFIEWFAQGGDEL